MSFCYFSLCPHFILDQTSYRWSLPHNLSLRADQASDRSTQCGVVASPECVGLYLISWLGWSSPCLCANCCQLSVRFASDSNKQLLPLCSSGHVRAHTVSSPLQHDVVLQGNKNKSFSCPSFKSTLQVSSCYHCFTSLLETPTEDASLLTLEADAAGLVCINKEHQVRVNFQFVVSCLMWLWKNFVKSEKIMKSLSTYYCSIFKINKILSWNDLIKYANLCLVYKIIHDLAPPPLMAYINRRTNTDRITRGV